MFENIFKDFSKPYDEIYDRNAPRTCFKRTPWSVSFCYLKKKIQYCPINYGDKCKIEVLKYLH